MLAAMKVARVLAVIDASKARTRHESCTVPSGLGLALQPHD